MMKAKMKYDKAFPTPCATQPGIILPFAYFSFMMPISPAANEEKKNIITKGIKVVLVNVQNKSKCTKPKITDCKILPVLRPNLFINIFARNPRNNISSDKDVFINE